MSQFSFRHTIFDNTYLPLTNFSKSLQILFSISRFTALSIVCTFMSIFLICFGIYKNRDSKITLYLILAMLMYEMFVLKSVMKTDNNNLRVIEKEWMEKFLERRSYFVDKNKFLDDRQEKLEDKGVIKTDEPEKYQKSNDILVLNNSEQKNERKKDVKNNEGNVNVDFKNKNAPRNQDLNDYNAEKQKNLELPDSIHLQKKENKQNPKKNITSADQKPINTSKDEQTENKQNPKENITSTNQKPTNTSKDEQTENKQNPKENINSADQKPINTSKDKQKIANKSIESSIPAHSENKKRTTQPKSDKKIVIKDPKGNQSTILKVEQPKELENRKTEMTKSNYTNVNGQSKQINPPKKTPTDKTNEKVDDQAKPIKKYDNANQTSFETNKSSSELPKNLNQENAPENVTKNATENDEYLSSIKSHIQLHQKTSYLLNKFEKSLHNSKKEIKNLLDEFKLNYKNLLSVSQKIEPTLLSMNIPIGVQKYEIEELENEINRKFELNLDEEQVISKIEDNGIKFMLGKQKETSNKPKTHNLMNENTNILQLVFLCECLFTFLFLITYIFKLNNLKVLRLISIVILSLNIFIGLYTLVITQLMFQKCNIKKSEGCKYNTYKLDEITGMFNTAPQNNISAIQTEFNNIAATTNKSVVVLDNYIKSNLRSKIALKIFIFENLIDKLKFIEADFENIFSNSVDKKQFYTDLDLLIRSLEKIKSNVSVININQLLDIYKDVVTTNVYFNSEKNEVTNKIKRIIKNESERYKKKNKKECEKEIEMVCKKEGVMDLVSIFLVFFSSFLGLLFLF